MTIGGWSAFAWLGLTALGVVLLILRFSIGPPFSSRTLSHSMVEIVDMLSTLALAPVAIGIYRLVGPTALSIASTAVGLVGVLIGAFLDVLFALDKLTFGEGASVPWLVLNGAAVLTWLILAGVCVLRTRVLPRYLGWLTIASGAFVIPLPIWAVLVGRHLLGAAKPEP